MESHRFQDKIQPNLHFYIDYKWKELGNDEFKI